MNSQQRSIFVMALVVARILTFPQSCEGRIGSVTEPVSNMFGSSVVDHPRGNFSKLSCNKHLSDDPCLTPWSSKFGTGTIFNTTVEIPCGICIVMNAFPATLELRSGLVILGKLVIPDGIQIAIEVTGILVHGELIMESSKPIDGNPDISITWLESPQDMDFRLPPGEGSDEICGGRHGACRIGKKPFVVAGGQIDIRGLPSPSMPTWVPLYDVDDSIGGWPVPDSEYKHYKSPPPGCSEDGILIKHDFSDGPHPAFSGSFGSIFEWTDRGLKVVNRTHTQHCPVVDLKYVRNCLQANRTLLLTAKLLLTQDGIVDQTDCAKGNGDNLCMSIYGARMSGKAVGRTSSIWKEGRSFGSMLGEEMTIAVEFEFTAQQLDEGNVFEILQLRGPGPGVDMSLSHFTLRYPPRESFPGDSRNICRDLVPSNGNAELLGFSPYPFQTNNQEVHLSVARENNTNSYFAITGREFTVQNAGKGSGWRSAGIFWKTPSSCIKTHAKYRFTASVRMHSLRPISSEWKLKGYFANARLPVMETIAECTQSRGVWVSCEGGFQPSEVLANAERYEVVLETDTSSIDVNYDVDNISFELIESALDRLVLPNSIENFWRPGAEILVSPHSSDWKQHSIRKIVAVENHDEDGYVSVLLDEAIPQPLTSSAHPYHATEVALLSRNIVFNGADGGHLTVLHTPVLAQVIQGVDFFQFGEEGIRDRYPIYFDNCQYSGNTVVSKNTIRRSNQRCIVLATTNDALVEGNVAFGNKGHCFVVDTGSETGNMFKANLGTYSKAVSKLMPQGGASGRDTDTVPAVFWIGSPANYWVDNVASGSEGHGYWLELRDSPRGPHAHDFQLVPSQVTLTEFNGNTAHSTKRESLAMTGYRPEQTAILDRFKSYLTDQGHFRVANSSNVAAHNTILDVPVKSKSLTMSGTDVIKIDIEDGEPFQPDDTAEEDFHGHAANPVDVFNLQPGAGLS